MSGVGPRDFEDQVVVVTGAGSGIGRSLSRAFAAEGAHVVAADLDLAAAEATANTATGPGDAMAIRLDVGDAQSWATLESAVDASFGRCDILCNNAGITLFGGFVGSDPVADWQAQARVNIVGPLLGCQIMLPGMIEQGSGVIVNTASAAGLAPWPEAPLYSASKHALVGLSTSLAVELADTGVHVAILCPGAVDTPMNEGFEPEEGERRIPPEEVAARVLDGIRARRTWIFTHAELLPFLEAVHRDITDDHAPLEDRTS